MSEAKAESFPRGEQPSIRVVMMPRDTNALGTIFGGVILSHIDLAAATEAYRYWPGKMVTVAMDRVEFHQPVRVGDLVSLFCEVRHLGRSSIAIGVDVWAQRRGDRSQCVHVTQAEVTLVALDDDWRPSELPRKPLDEGGRVPGVSR